MASNDSTTIKTWCVLHTSSQGSSRRGQWITSTTTQALLGRSSKDSFHGTAISLTQRPTMYGHGVERGFTATAYIPRMVQKTVRSSPTFPVRENDKFIRAPGHRVCEIYERRQLKAVCRDTRKDGPVFLCHGSYY